MKTIFSTLVGSRLYGTSVDGSDYDYKAVALPSAEDLLGLKDTAREHWELKNPTDQPGETVVYSVAKFLSLFMSGNPTVTELVFVRPEFYADKSHSVWEEVKHVAKNYLLSRKVVGSYGGYINDQFSRVKNKKAQNNREWMIEKHGYDVKCSGHVYRLAMQGHALLTTGTCDPTLSGEDRETCLSLRRGEKTFEEAMSLLEKAFAKFDDARKDCVLPTRTAEEMTAFLNKYLFDLHLRVVEAHLKESHHV